MSETKTDNTQVIINMQNTIDEQQKQIDELTKILSKTKSQRKDYCDAHNYIKKKYLDVIKEYSYQSLANRDARVINDFVQFYRDKSGVASSRVLAAARDYNKSKQGEE